jgi:sphingolipid delta-4 desaturase
MKNHMDVGPYIYSSQPEPHRGRTLELFKTHPEVRTLFENHPQTALYILAILGLQLFLTWALAEQSLLVIVLVAYTIGAFASHGLWVLIHEATHNLIFKNPTLNRWMLLTANLPLFFPSAVSFRNFHLVHHRRQGELNYDADLSGPGEASAVGQSGFMKALWLLFFFLVEGLVRPFRLRKTVALFDRWVLYNWITQGLFFAAIIYWLSPYALLYTLLSTVFSIGLHPLGARWIQEHFVVQPGQETYSYYGPLNKWTFNVGYHNEHHDLMSVPWVHLPKVRQMAPEFYDTLYFHTSWTRLLVRFLTDPTLTLFSRVVRDTQVPSTRPRLRPDSSTSVNPSPTL